MNSQRLTLASLMRKAPRAGLFWLAAASLFGCGYADSAGSESTQKSQDELYILTSQLWNTNPSTKTVIPVCWDDVSAATATERGWVRDQVTNTWSFAANVEFTGWGHCATPPDPSGSVHIYVADVGPNATHLGKALGVATLTQSNRVTFNFTFQNWSTGCQATKEYCIRNIAAHEFGHVLGFSHEQNRPDKPASCTSAAQGQNGDTTFGAWDLESIMDYCNPQWNNDGLLSGTDIAGSQYYYGVAPRFVAAIMAATP